ncbi:MAG: thiamine diphosphokinase [Oscillospiraceae bacterium]|nr:thiamine diphosphokinase [Oscillospiraceae bacterium]MBQ9111419.1 thiamine diphosphokinase [Oscillospiraceae bacterium]
MKHCVIIAGGDLHGEVNVPKDALLICADCGYRHAEKLGLHPDVLMGDFDSYTAALPEHCEILRHPAEKDETDTMLAVWYGRDRGCTEFHIYGAFGGARLDHSIANLQMLHHMAEQGLHGILYDGGTAVTVQTAGTVCYPRTKGYLSLFSLTDECTGLTVTGVKYPLEQGRLTNAFPLGVSNEILAENAEITLESGVLLIVQTDLSPNS